MRDFLKIPFKLIKKGAAKINKHFEYHVGVMSDKLRQISYLLMFLMPIGIGLGYFGYLLTGDADTLRYNWVAGDYVMEAGHVIIVLVGVISAFVLTSEMYSRATIANFGGAIVAEVLTEVAKTVKVPAMNLEKVHSMNQATKLDKFIRSVLATFVGGALYSAVFPVFVSIPTFLTIILIIFFVAYASAWMESSVWVPIIKQWSVVVAGVLLLVIYPLYLVTLQNFPDLKNELQSYKNRWMSQSKTTKTKNDRENDSREVARKQIDILSVERDKIIADYSDANIDPTVTEAKIKVLNDRIARLEQEQYLSTSAQPSPTPSKDGTLAVDLPSWQDVKNSAKKIVTVDKQSSLNSYGLEVRKAYKFDKNPKIYVFQDDGKLHLVSSELAYRRFYNCDADTVISNCAPIYRMPGVVPTDIFGTAIN